jgi:rhodanese-related sulfurtransferase
MKKAVISLMLLVALLLVVSCGQETEKNAQEAPKTEETVSKVEVLKNAVDSYFANMPDHIYKISQKEFVEKVRAGEDMVILDIRQAADYDKGHVKGAVNAPWGADLPKSLDFLPADKAVMVYCYSGQTAGQTVAMLNFAGVPARSVNLGFNFGISKVEGVEDVIVTDNTSFDGKSGIEVDPVIREAFEAYYTGLADVSDTIYKNYKISEDNLKKIVDAKDDNVYILSVRQEKDYNAGHIEGAELIAWGAGMEKSFDSLPADKKIVVYCYSGQTAGQTTAGLRMLGYDAVSLNGGMGVGANAPIGWSNKDYPVVSE